MSWIILTEPLCALVFNIYIIFVWFGCIKRMQQPIETISHETTNYINISWECLFHRVLILPRLACAM